MSGLCRYPGGDLIDSREVRDMPDPDVMTPTEVARLLGVSTATVRRWSEPGPHGEVPILAPSKRLPSGYRRYRRADVEALKAEIEGDA